MRYHCDLIYTAEWLKFKRQTVPSIGEDAEQGNSYAVGENVSWDG